MYICTFPNHRDYLECKNRRKSSSFTFRLLFWAHRCLLSLWCESLWFCSSFDLVSSNSVASLFFSWFSKTCVDTIERKGSKQLKKHRIESVCKTQQMFISCYNLYKTQINYIFTKKRVIKLGRISSFFPIGYKIVCVTRKTTLFPFHSKKAQLRREFLCLWSQSQPLKQA